MEARHRAFIAPRLLGSLIALAAFPVYLIMRGVPPAFEIPIFASLSGTMSPWKYAYGVGMVLLRLWE